MQNKVVEKIHGQHSGNFPEKTNKSINEHG